MRSLALSIFLAAFSTNASAAHPQLLLDSSELNFIRAKVAKNTPDWRAMKDTCDSLASDAVQWPDAISGETSAVRGYVAGSARSSGVIYTGYNGGRFEKSITELGVCYQAVKTSDSTTAGKYLAQAHNIITAISARPLTMTRQNEGAVRYALSVDFRGRDLPAGSPASVFLLYPVVGPLGDPSKNVKLGDVWTISGATGCTSLNGTWRVSAINRNVVSFVNPDGSPAAPLNANCTQFTFDPMIDTGFALRFWVPALAKAYDWFYDGLSQEEKDDLVFDMNAWMYELAVTGVHSRHPEENYAYGCFWALIAAYVATDGDNASWASFYSTRIADRLTGPNQIRDYWRTWMAGGGFGEGWQAYGFNATRWMMDAALAMKIHGTDWSQPPYNFNVVDDTLRYWMEFTTPSKLALDDNEYVYPVRAKDAAITEPIWIPLSHAVMFTETARRFHSPLAEQFQDWYREIYAKERKQAGKSIPEWDSGIYKSEPEPADEFLYYDPQAESKDWKTLPLMYRAWAGNYAVSRSDWSDDAVEITLPGGPSVGAAGNGKTQFDSGSISVQRGSKRLLVYGLGEAARSGEIVGLVEANKLHRERGTYGNKKNSIFWAGASAEETRNQGLTSRTPPPGQNSNVTAWGSSIDRAEDNGTYTYWRASGLEANNARSAIDGSYHQTGWTREVLFLRPKLVIVHDRTSVLNSGDDRAMFWTFGRNISRMESTAGMTRYDASFKNVFRGAFTSVLPASPSTISVVDHENLHFLYRVEVRPAAMDHKDDDWLAVVDAADSPKAVTPISRLIASNADAVQFADAAHTVVAFPQTSFASLPIRIECVQFGETYIAGLSPNASYKIVRSNTSLIIAADDGSNRVTTTSAGVLHISAR